MPRIIELLAVAGIAGILSSPSIAYVNQVQPPELHSDTTTNIASMDAAGATKKKTIDRRHPDFVRCRVEPVIRSRALTRRICMTNREWKLALRLGNRYANDFIDDN